LRLPFISWYAEAERRFKEALEEARAGFPLNDPHIPSALHYLAEFYRNTGRLDVAEPLYREVQGWEGGGHCVVNDPGVGGGGGIVWLMTRGWEGGGHCVVNDPGRTTPVPCTALRNTGTRGD
jgi:hypothetical protein